MLLCHENLTLWITPFTLKLITAISTIWTLQNIYLSLKIIHFHEILTKLSNFSLISVLKTSKTSSKVYLHPSSLFSKPIVSPFHPLMDYSDNEDLSSFTGANTQGELRSLYSSPYLLFTLLRSPYTILPSSLSPKSSSP